MIAEVRQLVYPSCLAPRDNFTWGHKFYETRRSKLAQGTSGGYKWGQLVPEIFVFVKYANDDVIHSAQYYMRSIN